jgi:diacylglycerol kinase
VNNRFYLALASYAVLGLMAAVTLEGPFRLAIWVFLGGLALKTWLVTLREKEQDKEE